MLNMVNFLIQYVYVYVYMVLVHGIWHMEEKIHVVVGASSVMSMAKFKFQMNGVCDIINETMMVY